MLVLPKFEGFLLALQQNAFFVTHAFHWKWEQTRNSKS